MLTGFEKAIELFNFKYLLKIDTDTWVSTPDIVDYLERQKNSSMLYIGLNAYVDILILLLIDIIIFI